MWRARCDPPTKGPFLDEGLRLGQRKRAKLAPEAEPCLCLAKKSMSGVSIFETLLCNLSCPKKGAAGHRHHKAKASLKRNIQHAFQLKENQ